MGIVLFYLLVCGLAYAYGGPGLALLACVGITVVWALSSMAWAVERRQVTSADRARHQQDGCGHIYYIQDGQMVHETDGCAACMAARADELQRQGYTVEHVPGRHNSGEL